MTVIELIKESKRMLEEIAVPTKYFETISVPVAAVHHNLGIVIDTLEQANAEQQKVEEQEAESNEDPLQERDI